jgi:RNA polymerase sigma-70 factor (ECF subfamily)
MPPRSLRERFKTSKEALKKLGLEFNSEALPLIEKLYDTSFWILLNEKSAKKLIKQTFYEAIENCDITKNDSDWNSWIHRIWIREILEYYSKKENDTQTVFDFIDHAVLNSDDAQKFFKSPDSKSKLHLSLEKLPAVLRIPLIMKEINNFNYEKIAVIVDVPAGVIATRIYRARKLLFLFSTGNFDYEKEKRNWMNKVSAKLIFDLRRCACFVDDELIPEQKTIFSELIANNKSYEAEVLIQDGIKKLFVGYQPATNTQEWIKFRIEKKARKKFGQTN